MIVQILKKYLDFYYYYYYQAIDLVVLQKARELKNHERRTDDGGSDHA